ncbi:MAG TPA: hypothetical protein PLB32_18770 [Acidobacteriota bacterium]|nr:hypothetical protein [Acidobacteriota bacterium]
MHYLVMVLATIGEIIKNGVLFLLLPNFVFSKLATENKGVTLFQNVSQKPDRQCFSTIYGYPKWLSDPG